MIFDGEQLTELLAPLDLGWRDRTEKELALMADLVPTPKETRRRPRHLGTQGVRGVSRGQGRPTNIDAEAEVFRSFGRRMGGRPRKLSTAIQLVSGLHLSPSQYDKAGTYPYFTGPSDFTNDIRDVGKWTEDPTAIAKQNDTLITVKGSGVGEIWYLCLEAVAMGRR